MGLLYLLSSDYDTKTKIMLILFTAVIVVFSLTVHEFSHALTALAFGDPTAKNRGRLTLNPLKHMNPIGTIMMLLIGFGYAEPVPINPFHFKNRKAGMAVTALAGPLSNFVLALISVVFYRLTVLGILGATSESAFNVLNILNLFLYLMALMNLSLMVFNMIPIPPLDGSRILNLFLPERYYFRLMRYEQYIALIFFGIVFISTRVFRYDILFGIPEAIFKGIYNLVSHIF